MAYQLSFWWLPVVECRSVVGDPVARGSKMATRAQSIE